MNSRIFLAKVDAIEACLEESIPELRKNFGEGLTLDIVRETIGTKKLLEEATNAFLRDNCALIRETSDEKKPWINIKGLYEKALAEKYDGCNLHGIVPYSHGYCPYCTK